MSTSTLFHSLFKYKAWANEEYVARIALLDKVQHASERETALKILDHTFAVDRIFAAHLQGVPHSYQGPTSPELPTLEQLSSAIRDSDQWYVRYVAELSPVAVSEMIDFTFTDDLPGRMSREEILAHVITHGVSHRGAIGRILTQVSIKPPREVFTGFLHNTEPASRRR